MKKYFIEYRPFLVFLAKFFVTYAILAFFYQMYLKQFDARFFEVDSFTQLVADQTVSAIYFLDSDVVQQPNTREASVNIIFNGRFIARIVEGCNALSIMILFLSFLIAFTGSLKKTVIFALSGVLIIHVFNVIRIALLVVAIYHYPASLAVLHDILFPLFIYGVVFILWLVWITKFSVYATNNNAK